jgi:AP-4 complex subunit epsilon-1
MAANLSKDFFELIKAIGESKSKQEEDRIIQNEVVSLKTLLQDLKGGNSLQQTRKMREVLVRLIYVEMLGHDASWGYVVAVQQTATVHLPQKRAGYLACSLMLHPDHEFRFMLVNQMQRDLGSANQLECNAALVALCKLVTLEMIPALLPKITEVLLHSEHTLVRKKAVMALHQFYQMDPHSVDHLMEQVKNLLRDRDPSVMSCSLSLLHDFAKRDPFSQLDLVDQYCSILKQITEHRLPRSNC